MSTHRITVEVEVEIEVRNEDAIRRCVENLDDQGNPQPDESGSRGWRNVHYPIETAEEVIEHLAYNYVVNGVESVARLDGWADLDAEAVRFRIEHVGFMWYEAVALSDTGGKG